MTQSDLFIPYLEVTIRQCKGHLTIPKKGRKEFDRHRIHDFCIHMRRLIDFLWDHKETLPQLDRSYLDVPGS